jgi:hypothetical protein
MFPFLIKSQQARLERYAASVAEMKAKKPDASVIGVKSSIEKANHAYSYYLLNTRNVFGRILSIIPGTAAFQTRIIAARKIDKAFYMLRQQEKKLKGVVTMPAEKIVITRKRSNSVHATADTLPKFYKSPLKRSPSENSNQVTKPDTVNKTIIILPTRLLH